MIALPLGAGVVIPRVAVRLTCTVLLLAFTTLTGFSFGRFYIPALGAAVLAALLQLNQG